MPKVCSLASILLVCGKLTQAQAGRRAGSRWVGAEELPLLGTGIAWGARQQCKLRSYTPGWYRTSAPARWIM